MSYPAELFAEIEIQPNLFKCEKEGKELFLFGTYHVLPFSVLPKAYLNIMKKAKRLLLEGCEASPTEADLIKAQFITAEPQDPKLYEFLSSEARAILENAVKKYCTANKLAPIPLHRIKLDRAWWLCEFASNVGGMEDTLENLFSPNIFSLEKRASKKLLPPTLLETLNDDLIGFECLKDAPIYHPEFLAPMDEYLVGNSLMNPHYSYRAEQGHDTLVSRNYNWIPEILHHFSQEDTILIAVGHMHLVGRRGLLCLLQNEGFKIFQYAPQENTFGLFKPNILFNDLAENRAIAEQIETELDEKIGAASCALVQEYWAPTMLLSTIYPDPKSEDEATHSLPKFNF